MSTRARQYTATVGVAQQLSRHLTRLVIDIHEGQPEFESTGVPDEWVGLVVPGQFQVRYYTVRAYEDDELVVDVVMHESGLVTEWVAAGCEGSPVAITEPKGSFELPDRAEWLMLVGDLTAMPAMARIAETVDLPVRIWAQVPDDLPHYLPARAEVSWLDASSTLADMVASLGWPETPGYFWMAGESADMRAIRKHLMRDRKLAASAYDVMGYWRAASARQPRAVDPGPIYRQGKAQGLSDEQIWAAYDKATADEARS